MADNFPISDRNGSAVTLRASADASGYQASVIVSELLTPTQNFTRPADTTAYAAGDAVSNSTSSPTVLTFASMARANGMGGTIIGARLFIANKAAIAAEFHLLLFNASPTANNDNAAFALGSADLDAMVGFLMFTPSAMTDSGNGSYPFRAYDAVNCPHPYRCGGSATSLYGLLTTRTAFTPASGTKFRVDLHAIKET